MQRAPVRERQLHAPGKRLAVDHVDRAHLRHERGRGDAGVPRHPARPGQVRVVHEHADVVGGEEEPRQRVRPGGLHPAQVLGGVRAGGDPAGVEAVGDGGHGEGAIGGDGCGGEHVEGEDEGGAQAVVGEAAAELQHRVGVALHPRERQQQHAPAGAGAALDDGGVRRAVHCGFVVAISDGFDAGGIASCADTAEYLRQMEAAGSDTLARLLLATDNVRVIVYDSHLPWARRVARDAGVAVAAFMTQMCAVDVVYGEAFSGRVQRPLTDGSALRRRGVLSVDLGPEDVPPFVAAPEWYPAFTDSALGQFDGLEEADDVLVNSFRDLEPKEADYMESRWRAKTIGPTLPSFYLDDDRLLLNKSYGFNLVSSTAPCVAWLDKQHPCSVVLASLGTVANVDTAQLEELAHGLCNAGQPFLWVLRSSEADKLPKELTYKCNMKGLIVPFCPQLEVLTHRATGCFLTHCGWNSTTEAIATGVPMVAIPQWADQPTTAKYVQSAWGIGLRAHRDDKGLVRREEVERCIKEVMGGDDYKRNACKWMQKAKEAMQEGGSSDKNIEDFVAKYL